MKIQVNVLKMNQIIDQYSYSEKGFYHNDDLLKVNNKKLLLTYFISMTSNWKETVSSEIQNCFEILVETGAYKRQYVFSGDYLPDNFTSFIYEIKKIAMEV